MKHYQLSDLTVIVSGCVYRPSGISFHKLKISLFIIVFHKLQINKLLNPSVFKLFFTVVWESTLCCSDMKALWKW
jgi:hypothetical protein